MFVFALLMMMVVKWLYLINQWILLY